MDILAVTSQWAKDEIFSSKLFIVAGVTVLPGVEIGDNCVIGAGGVVVKSIPSGFIAVGSPCRVIGSV